MRSIVASFFTSASAARNLRYAFICDMPDGIVQLHIALERRVGIGRVDAHAFEARPALLDDDLAGEPPETHARNGDAAEARNGSLGTVSLALPSPTAASSSPSSMLPPALRAGS